MPTPRSKTNQTRSDAPSPPLFPISPPRIDLAPCLCLGPRVSLTAMQPLWPVTVFVMFIMPPSVMSPRQRPAPRTPSVRLTRMITPPHAGEGKIFVSTSAVPSPNILEYYPGNKGRWCCYCKLQAGLTGGPALPAHSRRPLGAKAAHGLPSRPFVSSSLTRR